MHFSQRTRTLGLLVAFSESGIFFPPPPSLPAAHLLDSAWLKSLVMSKNRASESQIAEPLTPTRPTRRRASSG